MNAFIDSNFFINLFFRCRSWLLALRDWVTSPLLDFDSYVELGLAEDDEVPASGDQIAGQSVVDSEHVDLVSSCADDDSDSEWEDL